MMGCARRVWPFAGWALFGAAVAWATHTACLLVMAEPAPDVDYVPVLRAMTEEVQPEGEDAWEVWEGIARELYTFDGLQMGYTDAMNRLGGPDVFPMTYSVVDAETRQRAVAQIEASRWLIDRVAAAVSRPACRVPQFRIGSPLSGEWAAPGEIGIANTQDVFFVRLAREPQSLLLASMRVAAENGDWEEVKRCLSIELAIANHLELQGNIICWMRAYHTRAHVLRLFMTLIGEVETPERVCAELIEIIESRTAPVAPPERGVELKRLSDLEGAQWEHSPTRRGGYALLWWGRRWPVEFHLERERSRVIPPRPPLRVRLQNVRAWTAPRKAEIERAIEEWATEGLAWWRLPFEERGPAPAPPRDLVRQRPQSADILGVAVTRRQVDQAQTLVAAARIVLLLEMNHARTRAWPERLTEAMSAELARDPVSGAEFRYRLLGDDDRRGFELSVTAEFGESWALEIQRGYEILNEARRESDY